MGASLLITADMPTVSRITRAGVYSIYCSLALEIDLAVIAELLVHVLAERADCRRRPAPDAAALGGAHAAQAASVSTVWRDERPLGRLQKHDLKGRRHHAA